MRSSASYLLLIGALCLLAACAGGPPSQPVPEQYADEVARGLAQEGRFAEAAAEYLRISDLARSPDAEAFKLSAAAAYLDAGQPELASPILARLAAAPVPEPVALRRRILTARLRLLEGDPQAALSELAALDLDAIPPYLAREARAVGAAAREQTGDLGGAARDRAALDPLLSEEPAISTNRRALWAALIGLPPAKLGELVRPPPDTFGGWVELALIRDRYLADLPSLEAALEQWRARFPGHPAGPAIAAELVAESMSLSEAPRQVALLLPLSGQFQAAARAVRDGFAASWFLEPQPPGGSPRPALRIYDTAGADVPALYRRARAEGANFIVGPLRKDAVAALAAVPLVGPALVLNQVSPPPGGDGATPRPAAFYQFGLPPEDEAEQVAERARDKGLVQAVMLSPQSEWGTRVAAAFERRWSALGGVLVEARSYAGDANALSATVRELLRIDASEARYQRLKSVLNAQMEHEPRRRQDIDLIFLAAFPGEARQLRPQIAFFHASDVPIYATSHIYTGRPDAGLDRDLDGVYFCDMPWLIAPTLPAPDVRAEVASAWPDAAGRLPRFYALGADAHALVARVARLRSRPGDVWPGYTGRLSVDNTGKVQRELVWGRFRDGIPLPIDGLD